MALTRGTAQAWAGLRTWRKNDETCLLARDLVRLAGETMAGAIRVALRGRLARGKCRPDVATRVERLLAIDRRCAESLQPGPSAAEHGDLLLR